MFVFVTLAGGTPSPHTDGPPVVIAPIAAALDVAAIPAIDKRIEEINGRASDPPAGQPSARDYAVVLIAPTPKAA
jgi:hypothetical protein